MSNQYAERDACALDEAGGYYIRHVSAMTGEGLHSKGDIAAELGFRDMRIDQFRNRINQLLTERNATGVAIEQAMNGSMPDQHGLLSRLKMIYLMSAQRNELLSSLKDLLSSKEEPGLFAGVAAAYNAAKLIKHIEDGEWIRDEPDHSPDSAKMVGKLHIKVTYDTKEAVQAVMDAIPEGWKLVPAEPTTAMLAAFIEKGGKAVTGYKAMIAAAPKLGGDE